MDMKPSDIKLEDVEISFDETHHIYRGKPLYQRRFKHVMSFHEPGIAAVEDEGGAYHIGLDGKEVYSHRFLKTYGFYEGIATVVDERGYFHIDTNGNPVHTSRFAWAGNFQERRCVVRDFEGKYYHISRDGKPAYSERYLYVGDFKYGIAVAYCADGYARHIDRDGNTVHSGRYRSLGVYHKGFAIAEDEYGYFHINKKGSPIYSERFEWVEPFYNDYALVKEKGGKWSIIDANGKRVHIVKDDDIQSVQKEEKNKLMDYLVGYWKTQIIYAISKSHILGLINEGMDTYSLLQKSVNLPKESLVMLIKISIIWNFIEKIDERYRLTYLGRLLIKHEDGLKYAAQMWPFEHYEVMRYLYDALETREPQFKRVYGDDLFTYVQKEDGAGRIYYLAMDEYASDYEEIVKYLPLSSARTIIDVGGGTGKLLKEILLQFPNIEKGILFDKRKALEEASRLLQEFEKKQVIEFVEGDFFKDDLPEGDVILLSRVLHDWDDSSAKKILKNIRRSMGKDTILLIIETVVPEKTNVDVGISLNFNLLVAVGGKERSKKEFEKILNEVGMKLENIENVPAIVSILVCKKGRLLNGLP